MIRRGLFATGSKDKKEKQTKLVTDGSPIIGSTKEASDATPDTAKVVVDSDTEPPTCSDTDTSIDNVGAKSSGSDKSRFSKPSILRRKKMSSVRGTTSRKRVKRMQAGNNESQTPLPTPEPSSRPSSNPFANKRENQLGSDMMVLAEAMHLELNTQTMLAYYDARTLEDFCFMADADFNELVAKARTMNKALPPLQIRKVQVLRDWVKGLIETKDDDSNLPVWARRPSSTPSRKAPMIPKDWKARFKQDIPKLKQTLKAKGEKLSSYPWLSYLLSFRAMFSCG